MSEEITPIQKRSLSASVPAECAQRGAEWLDEIRPDWYKEMNFYTFSIMDEWNCILGQLYGNYFNAVDEHYDVLHDNEHWYGFMVPWDHSGDELHQAWVEEIAFRLTADHLVSM